MILFDVVLDVVFVVVCLLFLCYLFVPNVFVMRVYPAKKKVIFPRKNEKRFLFCLLGGGT